MSVDQLSPAIYIGKHKSLVLAETLLNCKYVRRYEKKNASAIRLFYGIPDEEQVVAFCKGTIKLVPLAIDGVIFTNQALYFRNANGPTATIRIGYSEIGKYIIAQFGETGEVVARSISTSISIYDGTQSKPNRAGAEIVAILNAVQDELCSLDRNARCCRIDVARDVIATAERELCGHKITAKTYYMLRRIEAIPGVCDQAAKIVGEWIFRMCDAELYDRYVNCLSVPISVETVEMLKAIPDYFYNKLIDLVNCIPSPISNGDLHKCYTSITKMAHSPDKMRYRIIQGNIAVKLRKYKDLNDIISDVRTSLGDNKADNLVKQCCAYAYRYLQDAFHCISTGNSLPSKYYSCRDGFGLTPLHYALILKDETLALHLIEQADFEVDTSSFSEYHSNFGLIAIKNQLSDMLVNTIIKKTATSCELTDVNIAIYEAKEELSVVVEEIYSSTLDIDGLKASYRDARSDGACSEDLEIISDNLHNAQIRLDDARVRRDELNDRLNELLDAQTKELNKLVDKEKESIKSTITLFENSQSPIDRYLYRLFFEPCYLQTIIHTAINEEALRVYKYKQFAFAVPYFVDFDPHGMLQS